jgi:hypothetical protein
LSKIEQHQDCTRKTFNQYSNYFGSSQCYAQLMSMPNNFTTVYDGNATITMRLGPLPDVPISIKTMDKNVVTIGNQDQ